MSEKTIKPEVVIQESVPEEEPQHLILKSREVVPFEVLASNVSIDPSSSFGKPDSDRQPAYPTKRMLPGAGY